MAREKITVTLPRECISWLDKKVEDRTYANRSHALEVLILKAMKSEGKLERKFQLLDESEKKT